MIFDIIVLSVLLISALHAFWRGFIREVLTIFGAIGGVFAALAFGDDVRPIMDSWLGVTHGENATKLFDAIPMSLISTLLSYGAVFILVFGILSFISHLIAEQVRALGLGAVDRTLGVVFGLARGFVILGIFYLPIHIMMDDKTKENWFQESQTHPVIEGVSGVIEQWMPRSFLATKEKSPQHPTNTIDPTAAAVQGVIKELKNTMTPDDSRSSPTPAQGYAPDSGDKLNKLINQQ